MAAIEIKKGTYRWNDTITNLPTTSVYILDFESNLGDDAKYTFNKLQSSGIHIQFYVASVNDETTNSAVGTFIDVYNLSSNLWQWSVQEFTITVATTVDSEFGTWFNNNATAISVEDTPEEPDTPTETKTIKKGTYRWNDILNGIENIDAFSGFYLPFTVSPYIYSNDTDRTVNIDTERFFEGSHICFNDASFQNSYTMWYYNENVSVQELVYFYNTSTQQQGFGAVVLFYEAFGYTINGNLDNWGKTITVTEDTTFTDADGIAFANWFEANAKPYTIPTEDSIIAKMKALIAKANITTGKSDTDLTEAILSLAAGYGIAGEGIVEVTSEATMTAILNSATTANSGKLYKYVGPGGTYCLGALSGSSTISAVPGVDMNYGFSNGARSIEFVSVDDAGTVTKPSSLAVNTAYKMRLYKDRASNTTNYFNGSVADGVLQTTTTPAEGANVYLEGVYDTSGTTIIGYRFYFMNGTDDTYIDVTTEGEIAFVIENPNAVYKQKTGPACWYTTVGTYVKNAYYRLEVK